jgi:NADH-quinone oxidoreductase subunit F
MEDIERLSKLAQTVKVSSLCALGQTAPNPVLSTIRYFRDEYEEHIRKHHCRATVCKLLVEAPCNHTCPAGMDAPRYVRLIGEGRFAEAAAVIREKAPLPAVLAHVCFHPCEAKCRRGQVDEPITIRALKRFAMEHDTGIWRTETKIAPSTQRRVAIVGSGPAGLTAAYYLVRAGHSVTVFEALPEAGGMMRVGIPDYRLPPAVLDKEIEEITALGVDLKMNTKIESVEKLFAEGFEAVFLAIGAHAGVKLGVEGEDIPGVIECVSFLREVNLGKEVKLGDRVTVVGGGNAAIDAARTALRLGVKEVTILYRRTQAEMPASPEEVEGALEEGVKIFFLAAPSRITRDNGRVNMECVRMELGKVDASGRRRPLPVKRCYWSDAGDPRPVWLTPGEGEYDSG